LKVILRPVEVPADFERMAELLSTFYSEPVTVEKLQEWEQAIPAGTIESRMAAVDEHGHMVGYSACGHAPFMLTNSFSLEIVVEPSLRRQGTGTLLYENAVGFARTCHATRLEAEVRDADPEWRQFAEDKGFRVDRHIFESALDLATFDESRFAGASEEAKASGVRFFTFAEVDNTEDNQHGYYELSKRNSLDIPGSEGLFPSFEDYRRFVFEASWYRPEGQFIAAAGEQWVGMSSVAYFKETNSTYTMHTGVLRDYRGRKIALALKLLGIRWSKQIGALYTRTNNDAQNAPILAINEKLGYQPKPGYYRMLKFL